MKKKIKIGRWIFLVLVAAIAWFLLSGDDGVVGLYQSHMRYRKSQALVKERNAQIDSLKLEERRLRSDTAYMEKVAREKWGMAKKNETIYKFVEEKKQKQ
jgi:cell division protein FtsB